MIYEYKKYFEKIIDFESYGSNQLSKCILRKKNIKNEWEQLMNYIVERCEINGIQFNPIATIHNQIVNKGNHIASFMCLIKQSVYSISHNMWTP